MTDTILTQWVILLLTIAVAIAMAMLPFVLRLVVRLELKLEEQQRAIDKLDEAVSGIALRVGMGGLPNNRPLPLLTPKEK